MRFIYFLFSFLTFANFCFATPSPEIKKALSVSWMVVIESVSGSAVAVKQLENGTLLLTNDHVCQASRGLNPLTNQPRFNSKLNSRSLLIQNLNERIPARVVYAANLHLLKAPQKGSDLCLLFVGKKIPVTEFSSTELEPGDELIGVSAPGGFFPSISRGYLGTLVSSDNPTSQMESVLTTTVLANRGSSGSGIFNDRGELAGIVFAIVLDDENHGPVTTLAVPLVYVRKFLNNYLETLKNKD